MAALAMSPALFPSSARGHGGIYISRVYTSAALVDLIPPYRLARHDFGLNISGFQAWHPDTNNNTIVGTSNIPGKTTSAGVSWGLTEHFALTVVAAGMTASGPEPEIEIPISASKGDFKARGFMTVAGLSFVAFRREQFELPVVIGAGKLWIRARKQNYTRTSQDDYWNTPAFVFGFSPRYLLGNWLLAGHLLKRRTPEAHESIKPMIASGQHGRQDFMDLNLGLAITYQPWGVGLVYTSLRDSVQSAGLRWSHRW